MTDIIRVKVISFKGREKKKNSVIYVIIFIFLTEIYSIKDARLKNTTLKTNFFHIRRNKAKNLNTLSEK